MIAQACHASMSFLTRRIQQLADGQRTPEDFMKYGDYALMFETVFYVSSPDYNIYMDKQQAINFALKDEFEREGIEFAYPTQQLYVTQQEPAKSTN